MTCGLETREETPTREDISIAIQTFCRKHSGISHGMKSVIYYPNPIPNQYFTIVFHHVQGQVDLPAMIDYALYQTGQRDLHYIGHSQGTTSFFVMASIRTDMNSKIRTMHAFGEELFEV